MLTETLRQGPIGNAPIQFCFYISFIWKKKQTNNHILFKDGSGKNMETNVYWAQAMC